MCVSKEYIGVTPNQLIDEIVETIPVSCTLGISHYGYVASVHIKGHIFGRSDPFQYIYQLR